MGVDLDLAGNHAEVKSLFGEELVPVAVQKNTQKERKQRFRFLYNTIFSTLLFLSGYIRIYRNV